MYLLGVDGGSTKIDFLVTTTEGKKVFEHRIETGSNLKYVGSDKVISNLKQGFLAIKKENIKLNKIKFCYLGIAECGINSGIMGRDEVFNFLTKNLDRFELADDQFSVFYSNSDSKNGVLANAGTGSNINRFFNNQEKTYKSLGYGGRDFGKMILNQIKYDIIKENTLIYKTIKDYLKKDPLVFYNSLEDSQYIINNKTTQIPRVLHDAGEKSPELMKELGIYLVAIGSRWGSKISSYCFANFGYKPDDCFDIVFTGGVWKWDKIRKIAITEIRKVFPEVNIKYNPDIKPVTGCIKIALEKVTI